MGRGENGGKTERRKGELINDDPIYFRQIHDLLPTLIVHQIFSFNVLTVPSDVVRLVVTALPAVDLTLELSLGGSIQSSQYLKNNNCVMSRVIRYPFSIESLLRLSCPYWLYLSLTVT